MNLRDLIGKYSERPGWRCPDETTLAAYVDRQLDATAINTLERHLAGCSSCLTQVSFLVKTEDNEGLTPVPASVLARTRKLVGERHSPLKPYRTLGWATAGAIACLLLVGIFTVIRQGLAPTPVDEYVARNEPIVQAPPVAPPPAQPPVSTPKTDPPVAPPVLESTTKRPSKSAVRSNDTAPTVSPAIIFPAKRTVVNPGELILRWKAVSDAVFYEVSVMNKDGDQVFNVRTQQTELKPAIKLSPGEKYFVQISAALHEGKTVKSNLVSFRVAN